MPEAATIVCKPTRWFLIRAIAMLGMFVVFTVWFYYDAEIGYRSKNEAFFTERAFHMAMAEFTRLNADGGLSPEAWRAHAAAQSIDLPDEDGILPSSVELPMPWPEVLHDFEKVRTLNPTTLWREYTGKRGMNIDIPESYYTPRKIHEQWFVFWVCLGLTVVTLFFLLRTMRRSIRLDDKGIQGAGGTRVAFDELAVLDLRKWDTKGIAFLEYRTTSGTGRMRLDGLTYGGFRHEDDQPAERMMEKLRANFTGEIIEYAAVGETAEIHGGELSEGRGEHIASDGDSPEHAPGEPR